MEQRRRAGPHGVLPVAELRQAVEHEVAECRAGVGCGDGEVEAVAGAEMIGETVTHEGDHVLGYGVGLEMRRGRRFHAGGQRLAVLGVEVPAALDGGAFVHQHAVAAAHLAVEELHPQRALALRPGAELPDGTQEARVGADLDIEAGCLVPGLHILVEPPFTALGGDDPGRLRACHGPHQFAAQALGVGWVVEGDVVHADAARPQCPGEVAHGGEHQHDFLLVVANVGALAHHFGHQHRVGCRVETLQSR